MTLRHKTFSAIRWTVVSAFLRTAFQFGQLSVLARILLPEDYGLMAMVTVVLSFGILFSDMGVNSAFVQRQEVSQEQRSSLYWFNVLFGFGVTILVMLTSPMIASFFGDSRLTPLIMLSSVTFFLGALGAQIKMAAEKRLDFRPVVLVEIVTGGVGFAVAVLAALVGWGVYSLVLAGIFSALLSTVLTWIFLSRGWRPLWHMKIVEVRSFLGFGGALAVNNIINQVNITIDLLLGGRLLSAANLGLYSIPRQLTLQVQSLVNPIVTRVGFPLIAQVQADLVRVKTIYLKTINMTASTNAPIYIGISFFAPEVVAILLGPGWERSGELLRVLAIWGAVRATGNPVGSLVLGMGRADLLLKWNLGLIAIIPVAVWAGSYGGPEGITWALLMLQVCLFVPAWFFLVRPICCATLIEYSTAALKPFIISVLAFLPIYMLAMQFENDFVRLSFGVLLALPLYFWISFVANNDWNNVICEFFGKRY